MTKPTINPDYQLYVCRFNVMYHDYNMTEADIAAMLGPEPVKYLLQVESSAATVERIRSEMRQARHDERQELQREYDGRELVDQETPYDGWL